MPLLKKKVFEKAPMPEGLRDNEEVFYCAVTNEIFRNYEEFSERMFLCNSMVWTCSMTGKTNLTFAEALESEENAKKSLREFPAELKTPILYLASKTKRTAFGDMAEDVFSYAKDRFFIGENVETSFTGTKWKDSHVLQVIAPQTNGNIEDRYHPSASLYKYEIEHLDADDEDISEIMIVDCNQIRRKKGSFSREKCKLFLKQHVEQDGRGIFVIKQSTVESFKLNKITFEKIFDGPPPAFDASRKFEKVVNGKKIRQESLHKFLTKNSNGLKTANNSLILEKIKQREEERQLIKQQKKEAHLAMKQKLKEENVLLAGQLKDWYKPKEDLELIDHKKLPVPCSVNINIPDEYFGDMLMVMEFVNSFSKQLATKDFFPGGLTVELMERALMKKEVAGPYIDLIQMLLNAIFNAQEEEASQYKTQLENPSNIKSEYNSDNMNYREATRLATVASTWSTKYQGLPLGRLPLYSLTTSEILRLHLLGSGAIITSTGARWRYQQRGGYTSEDDPGLYLRLHSPHILKALELRNVVELPIADKLEILSCLMNQLLTYADVRDIVEERMEKMKQAKIDHKVVMAAEKRREQDFQAAEMKLKKDKSNPKREVELQRLVVETTKKKMENERKLEELKKTFCDKQVVMGYDRAMRQYLKMESVPGFFVNSEDENVGTCLNNIVKQNPDLVDATRDETLAHIKKTLKEADVKDNSPVKSPKKANGINNSLIQQSENCDDYMLCSADPETCVVHSVKRRQRLWCFYKDTEKLDELVKSLNKRGLRESELQQNLENNKEEIVKLIEGTPVSSLNTELVASNTEEQLSKEKRKKASKAKYEDANLGYSLDMNPEDVLHNVLVDNILEMEEKIYAGNLGCLMIKDREKWRSCLQNKNYKELNKTIIKRDSTPSSENTAEPNIFINNNGDLQDYNDADISLPDLNSENKMFVQKEDMREAVQSLAYALIQVAQGVEPKYLKKPLGRINTGRGGDIKKKENMLCMWEKSLMVSTSFSQVFLHYSTLDSCVAWGKSVLLARCKICRRQNDSENMLLCDSCNWGHHLYCLKPKLKAVPPGDWFCNRCLKEKKIETQPVQEAPPKKRRIFQDEEESEDEVTNNIENGYAEDGMEEEEDGDEEEGDDEEEENNPDIVPVKVEVCKACGSGGEMICCENCSNNYHTECVEPPLRRPPRGSWTCTSCKKPEGRKRRYDKSYKNGAVVQHTGVMNGQRRCAAKALYKIHDFAKSLRQLSESDESSEDEMVFRRSTRSDEGCRVDLPLHNAALHEVLSEIMKDNNAWPFLRPVKNTEVPDYYDVITKPMDFGTIKYKLNMGEYHEDAHFMADALLVFQNCNTYNHSEDDVYKCGVALLKRFQKKCRELGLKLPEELDYDDCEVRPKKKIRTK